MGRHHVGSKNEHGVKFCPICGKPDFCITPLHPKGYYYHVCFRSSDSSNVMGTDGNLYIYKGLTKNGDPSFVEANTLAKYSNIKYDSSKAQKAKIVQKQVISEDLVKPLPGYKLHRIYSDFLDMLVLDERHRQKLLGDGWTDELIRKSGVKTYPEPDGKTYHQKNNHPKRYELGSALSGKYGDLTGVPGAYIATSKRDPSKKYWTFSSGGGMIFPIRGQNRKIKRLRIRLDNTDKSKYRPLTSYWLDKETGKNVYQNGTKCGDHISLFFDEKLIDVPSYWNIFRITEGWKKGYIINEVLKSPSASLPGVAFVKLITDDFIEFLKERQVNFICIDFDADYKTNKWVEKELYRIKERLEDHLIVGVSDWDKDIGKGIDDYILAGHKLGYKII